MPFCQAESNLLNISFQYVSTRQTLHVHYVTTNVIPLYSAPIQGSIKYHIRGGTNQTSRSPFRRRWHTEEFEQRRRMDDIQASERACWFSSSIVFANALIEQVELTVTVWQGNWAEIASTQVYMCEKHTHTVVCIHCFSVALILHFRSRRQL